MALSWSLPTGFDTPVTYFYVVYFAVLLIHRGLRDDEACEKKSVLAPLLESSRGVLTAHVYRYGKDWAKYKQLVPYRIVPYVY